MDFRNAGLPLPFTRWWLTGGASGAAATFSGRWSMMQAKIGDGIAAPGDNQRRGSAADRGQSAAPGRRRGARKKRRMGLCMGELGRPFGSAHGIVLTLFSPRYLRLVSFLRRATKWFSLLLNYATLVFCVHGRLSTHPGWSTGSSLIEEMKYILSIMSTWNTVVGLYFASQFLYCNDNTLYAYSLNCSKDKAGKCVGPFNMDNVHVRATGHCCLSYEL